MPSLREGRGATWAVSALLACFFAGPVMAQTLTDPLPPPSGEVILAVDGAISVTNQDGKAVLDRALIEAMGLVTVHTGTIWTDGVSTFEGVDLSHLLERLGATGTTLRLTALNDYAVEMPAIDAVEGGPMLAVRKDGKDLSARDKGPIWMIYPYDANVAYRNDVSYARSIWHLSRIEVLD